MKLIVRKPFDWAHQGIRVEHFAADAEIETSDQALVEVSTRERWAELVGGPGNPTPADESPSTDALTGLAAESVQEPPVKPGRKGRTKE